MKNLINDEVTELLHVVTERLHAHHERNHPMLNIDINEVAYHRNGVGGAGFHVVLFTYVEDDSLAAPADGERHEMVGVVFDEPEHVAVFDVVLLARSEVAFGGRNSWRGDNFEPQLRQAVADFKEEAEDVDRLTSRKIITGKELHLRAKLERSTKHITKGTT